MENAARTLFGTTDICGSVPAAGPVYSKDGRLVLSASFIDLTPVKNLSWLQAGLSHMLSGDDFVEAWRIWDCYEESWAPIGLFLYRFEMFDLVIRLENDSICSWQGAIDTRGRVLASLDKIDCEEKCWQWLRSPILLPGQAQ